MNGIRSRLDFSHYSPDYWTQEHEEASRRDGLLPPSTRSVLDVHGDDYCAIEDSDFFVRGLIHLPDYRSMETFAGVLALAQPRELQTLVRMDEDPARGVGADVFWLAHK